MKSEAKSVWIHGHEGRYKISSDGFISSHYRGKIRQKKPYLNRNGYMRVDLNNGKKFYIHLLVAKHFVSGWAPGLEVNHKNCNKLDNRAENLEWVTGEENRKHAIINGISAFIQQRKPVKGIHVETGAAVGFKSIAEAARSTGGCSSDIIACCKGKHKTSKGYRWNYI